MDITYWREYMKKLLILFLVSIIGLTGCGVKEDENGLKITPEDKREELDYTEYANKIEQIYKEAGEKEKSANGNRKSRDFNKNGSIDGIEIICEGAYNNNPYIIERVSLIKPKDEKLNNLHNQKINLLKEEFLFSKNAIERNTDIEVIENNMDKLQDKDYKIDDEIDLILESKGIQLFN